MTSLTTGVGCAELLDLDRRMLRQLDWVLVAVVVGLLAYGLLAIYSATHNLSEAAGDPLRFVKRQAVWGLAGLLAGALSLGVDYREWARFSRLLYLGTLLLLGAALALAPSIAGAERWLVLGPVRLQPSEFAKLAIILVLARHLSERDDVNAWRGVLAPLAMLVPPVALIVLQPDLGTALIFAGIFLGMLYVAGARFWHLALLVTLGLSGMVAAIVLSYLGIVPILKEYQVQRLIVFLDPYAYQHAAGWNVIQSMIAIGSGQFFGKGLFGGSQTQLNFLPARHTDFIFSVIGEEFGFLGAVGLMALYFLLAWRLVHIIARAKDRFGALLVAGCVSMLGFHLLINLGMAVGLMPVTGLPLPFISYGGSSLVTNLLAMALSLNVGMRRKKIRF